MPSQQSIISLVNVTTKPLPPSKNLLSPISQETPLVFSVPYSGSSDFVKSIQELGIDPTANRDAVVPHFLAGSIDDGEAWIMSAKKNSQIGAQRSFRRRVSDGWAAFTDLLKV